MIRVFSTPTCPFCYTLKEFLKDKNIEFVDVDVSQDEKAREEMTQKSGQIGVPVIDINGEFIAGFDREKIVKLLGIED